VRREQSEKILEQFYKIVKIRKEPFLCVYCGDFSTSLDHCPPLSRFYDYKAFNLETEMFLKVPACTECNSLLGSKLTETFEERLEMAKDLINKKYSKLFKGKLWTELEIKDCELNGQLERYVRRCSREQKRILERLNFYDGLKAYQDYLLEL